MPHIPEFPPNLEEWSPLPPPALPVPRWMINPSWLSEAQREPILRETGKWATSRAEAMVPSNAGPEAVRRAALSMWGGLQRRYGIVAPTPTRARRARETPPPVETRARAPRQPRAPAVVKAPRTTLTAEEETALIANVTRYIKNNNVLPDSILVQRWAKEQFGVELSEERADRIVLEAPGPVITRR